VKRVEVIRHLEANGCNWVREGGNHTVYRNHANGRQSTVPRHTEIKNGLVRKICKTWRSPPP
jgi:mRNA interferase HicA